MSTLSATDIPHVGHGTSRSLTLVTKVGVGELSSPLRRAAGGVKRKKGPAPKSWATRCAASCAGGQGVGLPLKRAELEGCKGFFRRSVIKGAQYACKSSVRPMRDGHVMRPQVPAVPAPQVQRGGHAGGSPSVEVSLRATPHPDCSWTGGPGGWHRRLVGVLSEEQIRLKKMKKQHEDESARTSSVATPTPPPELLSLGPEQQDMIDKLVAMQKQCNKRSFIDRPKVTPWPLSQDPQNREVRQQRFAHFTELAIMSVQEIVDFAKQLPGFLELTREDQIALLKTSTIEIMLLETSRRYNPAIESITFLKDFSYNKEDFAKAGLQFEFINPIFEFSKGMNDLHLDEAEYALLIAINIFSADRPNVQDHDLVERLQQPYVDALRAYISIKRPNDNLMFPRMLMKLVSLRTLSSVHSEQVFALRLQDKKLPPLLSEIWDVHE
ncbi:unnamed protein product [Boreogadus saida]